MKTQRKQRILTGLLLGLTIIATVFFLPSLVFITIFLALSTWAASELVVIWRHWAPEAPLTALLWLIPLASAALVWVTYHSEGPALNVLGVTAGIVVAACLAVLWSRTPFEQGAPAVGFLAFGTFYFAVPVVCFYHLHRLDPWVLFLLTAIVGFGDTAAYFIGSWIGRHKIAPRVSPNKSWEGSIAGALTAVLITAGWCAYRFGEVAWPWLLLAAATQVTAQFGDLVESLFKRGAGVKDSSLVLPGHGGIYDRLDAMLLAAPAFLFGLLALGLTEAIE